MRSHWLGRIALGSVAGFGRLDLFDRAMSLAAQLFSSVLPILIMLFVWVGQATTESVVLCFVMILVWNYFMTSIML